MSNGKNQSVSNEKLLYVDEIPSKKTRYHIIDEYVVKTQNEKHGPNAARMHRVPLLPMRFAAHIALFFLGDKAPALSPRK